MKINRWESQPMPRLVAEQHAQFAESAKLEKAIRQTLKPLRVSETR